MKNTNSEFEWIEVKKEFDMNAAGEEVATKIYYEKQAINNALFSKKELIDYLFKIIGILSIFIPIIIFFQQQNAEKRKSERLKKIELYSEATVALHSFSQNLFLDSNYNTKAEFILYGIYPRISFMDDKLIIKQIESIKNSIFFTGRVNKEFIRSFIMDSITTVLYHMNLNYSNYDSAFKSTILMQEFYRLKQSRNELNKFLTSQSDSENNLIAKYSKKIDSLLSLRMDVIYYAQGLDSRDSILEAQFGYPSFPIFDQITMESQYQSDYNIFMTNEINKLDSLMKISIKKEIQ